MAQDKDLKNDLEKLYAQADTDEKTIVDHFSKNFTPKDLATMATILSLYQPLLSTSNLIHLQLILLNKAGQTSIPAECIQAMEAWMVEFKGLNERVRIFNSGETVH